MLRAELEVAGRHLGIIVGLALGGLGLAFLLVALLYVGGLLFLGEWLFGSMAWGILDGTLLTLAVIATIGLDLAGAQRRTFWQGLLAGALVLVVTSVLFASNVLRDAAVGAGDALEDSVALEPALLPTLVGLVTGAVVGATILLIVGWRTEWSFGRPAALLVAGLLVGGAVGAVLGSVTFDIQGAIAVGLTLGLASWGVAEVLLAARAGFDPEARYAPLVPRASLAAFEESREFAEAQLRRQKRRVVGR